MQNVFLFVGFLTGSKAIAFTPLHCHKLPQRLKGPKCCWRMSLFYMEVEVDYTKVKMKYDFWRICRNLEATVALRSMPRLSLGCFCCTSVCILIITRDIVSVFCNAYSQPFNYFACVSAFLHWQYCRSADDHLFVRWLLFMSCYLISYDPSEATWNYCRHSSDTFVRLVIVCRCIEIVAEFCITVVWYKKAQLSLTNPRDACEKFARFT